MVDEEFVSAVRLLRDRLDRDFADEFEGGGDLATGLLEHLRSRKHPSLPWAAGELSEIARTAAKWDPAGYAFDKEVADQAVEWRVIAASNPTSRRFVTIDRDTFDFSAYDHFDPQALMGLNRQRWFASLTRVHWDAQDRRYFDAVMAHWDFYAAKVPEPDTELLAQLHGIGPDEVGPPYGQSADEGRFRAVHSRVDRPEPLEPGWDPQRATLG